MNEFVDAIRNNEPADRSSAATGTATCCWSTTSSSWRARRASRRSSSTPSTALYEGAKQIVLSSDRHPRSIATLEDRLRSRFEWGLITDVQPPELETRLAILRKKAEGDRIPIPDEVLEFIATHVRDNIRELEGALIRVSAFASLNREPLTREMAERVLSDILDADRPRQITAKLILDATADDVRLQRRGAVRDQPASAARQRPPDRHVRVPGADRLQLPGHRP